MNSMFKIVLSLILLAGCQSKNSILENSDRTPSNIKFSAEELENDKDDLKFLEMMSTLDLENSTVTKTTADVGKYFLEYKKTSTSAGVRVHLVELKDGKIDLDKIGKWVPENSANVVEVQVVAYNLARFLHMGDLAAPSAYYTMGPKGLALFLPMLKCESEKKGQHQDNCKNIRAALKKNPNAMVGSFVDQISNEQEVLKMNTFKGAGNGKLDQSHPIAKFINVKGPMPSADVQMDLGLTFENAEGKKVKGQNSQLNLARQFSKIMVLDILTGQWDRFSGGNIEAIFKKKKNVVQFIAIDNGGASMKGAAKLLYWEAVTRFDKAQIERVEHLLNLLKNDKAATAAGLGIKSDTASLVGRIEKLLAHVEAQVKTHGEAKAFFPE